MMRYHLGITIRLSDYVVQPTIEANQIKQRILK